MNGEGALSRVVLCALNPLYCGLLSQKMLLLPLLCLPSISSRVNPRRCRGVTAQLIPLFHPRLFCVCRGGSEKEHLEKPVVKSS